MSTSTMLSEWVAGPVSIELPQVASAMTGVVLSFIFAQAGLHKLRSPDRFVATLQAYRVLPVPTLKAVAVCLMLTEAGVAISVWLPPLAVGALGCASLLLTGYGAAIALNLGRGRHHIDCGCGFGAQPISWGLVVRNAVLLLVCLMTMRFGGPAWSGVAESSGVSGGLLVAGGAAGLLLCHRAFETLLANGPALARLASSGR